MSTRKMMMSNVAQERHSALLRNASPLGPLDVPLKTN